MSNAGCALSMVIELLVRMDEAVSFSLVGTDDVSF